MRSLLDDAVVVRTKNAGPFVLTYDVIFADYGSYQTWQASGEFDPSRLASLLGYDAAEIDVVWFPPARAVKVAVPRRVAAGAWGDTDIFGCQQNAALFELAVPMELVAEAGSE